MFADFHFIRPYWFIALLPIALLLWRIAKRRLTNPHWERVCDPALLPYILVGKTERKHHQDLYLLSMIAFLSVIALAGPTWQKVPQPLFQQQSALVIALDLSYSMYADDIKPNRFERARFKITDILNLRKEGQTALLVYAGDSFIVTPLTHDTETIKSQLTALSPEIMPTPGNNTAFAIEQAVDLLKQAGARQGHILLITDEIPETYKQYFQNAYQQGYAISILGMGTDTGAPAKLGHGGFLKDRMGNIVIPKLDQQQLRTLANIGGGLYVFNQINDEDIIKLNALFMRHVENKQETPSTFQTDQWQELGAWLILLIAPIAAFGFRRGYLSLVIALLLINPDPALALEWDDLWLNKTQQAIKKYQDGDYDEAAQLLAQKDDVTSLYIKATALAKQGNHEAALSHYDKVLNKQPDHEDAQHNKQLIEAELQKQQSEQDQANSDQTNSDQTNSDQTNADQTNADQTNADQTNADQTNSDQTNADQTNADQTDPNQTQQQALNNEDHQASTMQQKALEATEQESEQESNKPLNETEQASEQWLRRIPDDPAGLLRRKFKYQYQQRARQSTNEQYW